MKQYSKKTLAMVMALALLCAALCGCARNGAAEEKAGSTADAVAVISDIATTQYFTEEPAKEEDVKTIVQAGINAPSAMNGQPWHFSVITNKEVLQQIAGGMGFGGAPMGGGPDGEMAPPEGMMPPEGMTPPEGGMPAAPGGAGGVSKAGVADAPLVIVVSCRSGSELDAGLACQNMSAAAQLLGYGTKIVTSPTMALNGANQEMFRELLGIPGEYSAAAVLLVGYADTSVDESVDGYTGATERLDAGELVTYVN